MHCPSSRKGSRYLRLPQLFVALQLLPLYYLEQLDQLANEIKAMLIKEISRERNIISKYFQRCDSYCLFTQISFEHVRELGNLRWEWGSHWNSPFKKYFYIFSK